MAERFNLTAQIQLQAPQNTSQVVNDINRQLKGIKVDLNIKSNVGQVAKLNKQLQNIGKAGQRANNSMSSLNSTLVMSARRFSAITVATGTFLALARSIKNSVSDAISFERELLKISQVTGKTTAQLNSLTSEVRNLAKSLGTSSADLLNVSRVLAQAGFSAIKTKQALEILAQTTLAATFDDIQDTTEGAIALLRQFSKEAKQTGDEVKFLESSLDSINAVSKKFAVEAGDLVTVIRRVGGVFSAAGGSVNELIALFTSVRATTRESAETIATGLRTIFTRIQRTDTVDQLKELGVELRDAQGQFVGTFEAVRRLSVGLSALRPSDARFSDIIEELGGFRQVGKVIPLIQQFATAQAALTTAQSAAGSVAKDAATAQKGLGVEITKVKEEFAELIAQFTQTDTFQGIARDALSLASAFIKVASGLEKVLPQLTLLASLKIGRSLAPLAGAAIKGLVGKNQGGKIHAFARGGFVPGDGNSDTVPAMLSPGEFVIKKRSAKKLGPDTLDRLNRGEQLEKAAVQKLNNGGKAAALRKRLDSKKGLQVAKGFGLGTGAILRNAGDKTPSDDTLNIGGAFLQPQGLVGSVDAAVDSKDFIKAAKQGLGGGSKGMAFDLSDADAKSELKELQNIGSKLKIRINSGSLSDQVSTKFRGGIQKSLAEYSKNFASSNIGTQPSFSQDRFKTGFQSANLSQIEGGIFEAFIAGLSRTPFNEQKLMLMTLLILHKVWVAPPIYSACLPRTLQTLKELLVKNPYQVLLKRVQIFY